MKNKHYIQKINTFITIKLTPSFSKVAQWQRKVPSRYACDSAKCHSAKIPLSGKGLACTQCIPRLLKENFFKLYFII